MNLVGLVPAAGRAERMGRLPCSKEILPVAVRDADQGFDTGAGRLLRQLGLAGVERAFIVLDPEKADVVRYLGDGGDYGLSLAYLTIRRSRSTPATVDRAFGYVREATVAFGFPDILLRPDDTFARLLDRLGRTSADAILGLFPAQRPEKVDMVEVADSGLVQRIVIKPERTALELAWIAAVWTPTFTAYLHDFLANADDRGVDRELYAGDVLQAAVDEGLQVYGVPFLDGEFRDIGTRDELIKAWQEPW